MKTFTWLMKREFWEHKGAFFWTPVAIGSIMLLLTIVTLLAAVFGLSGGVQINGVEVGSLAEVVSASQKAEFAQRLLFIYTGVLIPFAIALGFYAFFFCSGALYDERKDRSVLFWKSLPLSDGATVLSKVAMAIGVAPVIALAIATITAVLTGLLTTLAAAIAGVNIFADVLGNPATYLAPFQIAALLPIYALWALPTIGWLLMVSAWARNKPFLWAVGVPIMAGVLASWASNAFRFDLNLTWVWKNMIGRLLLSVLPGSWLGSRTHALPGEAGNGSMDTLGALVSQSWQQLAGANIWIGAALGAAMIYAAIRLRGWRDEG